MAIHNGNNLQLFKKKSTDKPTYQSKNHKSTCILKSYKNKEKDNSTQSGERSRQYCQVKV